MNNAPRVVIIGGGFGGLCAARGLVGAPVSVTLIDKRNYHLFRPMLYQVATAIAGRTYALADLRMLRFTGFPAWVVWAVVHIYFLIGFANRFFVMLQWVLTFLTKRRHVRIFPGQERAAEAP